jgi:hypothetical protein
MYVGPEALIFVGLFVAAILFALICEVVDRRWQWVSRTPQLWVAIGDGLLLVFVSVLLLTGETQWWMPWAVFAVGGLPTYLRSEFNDHRRDLRAEEHVGR